VVEDRKRDVDEQQARNGFVDAAILSECAGEQYPQAAADHAGGDHRELYDERRGCGHCERDRRGGERAHQERAFAADDDEAQLRRQRRAQRGQYQGRRAAQRVLPGEPGAERALIHVEVKVERVLAEQRDKDAEHHERASQRRARDQDIFDGRTVTLEESGIGGRRDGRRVRHVGGHEVAPITPSTR
jgi:hypothetical protein